MSRRKKARETKTAAEEKPDFLAGKTEFAGMNELLKWIFGGADVYLKEAQKLAMHLGRMYIDQNGPPKDDEAEKALWDRLFGWSCTMLMNKIFLYAIEKQLLYVGPGVHDSRDPLSAFTFSLKYKLAEGENKLPDDIEKFMVEDRKTYFGIYPEGEER